MSYIKKLLLTIQSDFIINHMPFLKLKSFIEYARELDGRLFFEAIS